MELKILSPQESGFVKEIQWNSEELKAEISEKMEEYKSLVFTEDTIKEAKVDRTKLNKLRTAFDDERKRIKKLCLAPYDVFEKQVKEVISLVDEPIQLIDKQIKEVEEQKKIEKKGKIFEFYEETIGTLKGVLPFDKVFRPEYLNVTRSIKSITEEISALIDRVDKDLDTIDSFGEKFNLQIKDAYLRNLDMSEAMREKTRLEEVEKKIQERQREETQRAAEATEKSETEIKEAGIGVRESIAEEEKAVPQLIKLDFRVWGTKEQLMSLKKYMIENQIKFGKVE